ncbi:hypothetical protein [Curtobacterium sp. MCBD17_003]|uniref:hypothetical protein n=1 Tax=Curtobacterium sp. MCBD17_003 TaxID=2175667 RepID=UPI000DAA9E34|nr:hypothetical protein [Curtobacterium sp. MCBD17_003]WIE54481.1 hypothetical protein DEI88_015385 [Curtobacterium sp. MCBD17_003]
MWRLLWTLTRWVALLGLVMAVGAALWFNRTPWAMVLFDLGALICAVAGIGQSVLRSRRWLSRYDVQPAARSDRSNTRALVLRGAAMLLAVVGVVLVVGTVHAVDARTYDGGTDALGFFFAVVAFVTSAWFWSGARVRR